MKTRVVVLVLLALAGCGRGDEPGKSTTAKTAAKAPPATVDAVAAVLQSTGTPVARMNFMLPAKPLVGAPAKMRLDVSAAEAASLLITVEADGLAIDPDSARGSLVLTGGGTVTSRELLFTAEREGLLEIVVRLRKAETDSIDTVYAIPVLIGPAASGG
ncbi:MAG: hypothetical protein ABIP38_05705 [Steroidobacteraceae bacterium]